MLIVLLFFSLFRLLQGVSLSSPAPDPPDGFPSLTYRDMESHFGQRTTQDIVLSCLATIFACTWSAIHPNIPAPTDCWWTQFKRQVMTMVYALVAPELMTVWALRQRMGAKAITDEYNREILGDYYNRSDQTSLRSIRWEIRSLFHDAPIPISSVKGPRWTLAHGFFLQMGGFMLSDCGQPIHTLLREEKFPDGKEIPTQKQLIYCVKNNIVDPPRLTEDDIMDRSKGDTISKILIILQTTWFIVQCMVRWSHNLPITQLEVLTLGFAMLNGTTYALWWHKPQNVRRPVFLERKERRGIFDEIPQTSDVVDGSVEHSEGGLLVQDAASESFFLRPIHRKESWFWRKWRTNPRRLRIFMAPWDLIESFLRPLGKLLDFSIDDDDDATVDDRVPAFYSSNTPRTKVASIIMTSVLGALFGAVHLIPSWFLDFSSPQEMSDWRSSAFIITIEPLLLGIIFLDPTDVFTVLLTTYCLPLYAGARIFLFILSLKSLRSLPPAFLQTIEWTTFIPHL